MRRLLKHSCHEGGAEKPGEGGRDLDLEIGLQHSSSTKSFGDMELMPPYLTWF